MQNRTEFPIISSKYKSYGPMILRSLLIFILIYFLYKLAKGVLFIARQSISRPQPTTHPKKAPRVDTSKAEDADFEEVKDE